MEKTRIQSGKAPLTRDNRGRASFFPFGLSFSQRAWDTYQVGAMFGRGRAREGFTPARLVQELSYRMNTRRAGGKGGQPPVSAAHLLMAGLLEDILRYMADLYCLEQNPGAMRAGLLRLRQERGRDFVERPVEAFLDLFPPQAVLLGERPRAELHAEAAKDTPERHNAGREIVLLYLAMSNPAFEPFRELFDDTDLGCRARYRALVSGLEGFFAGQPPVMPVGQKLFDCLRAPILASPHSIEGQLEYVRRHWTALLPEGLLEGLSLAEDLAREETVVRGFGPGPVEVLRFGADLYQEGDHAYPEPERFTPDRDWMANVVLIAKSVHVWLDQLSKKHQRAIRRLDEIPDEELDILGRWGFTGLWLIGIWERCTVSQRIKQMTGNPEAASSAYSLHDYVVADELGGPEAADRLRARAWRRGIRIACDMVPNHVGIYSKWVVEHPDWFLQSDHPPYPAYRFTGENLSPDPRISIFIEDGYWDRRDAAVVFKWVDNESGRVRFIYHGNDGTNMPWNDTAQLNYLLPEVREAVAATILAVARQFPIIRFDAAMTLTKRHYQRLWFPKPGDGGAIPSRSEFGLPRSEFDDRMPDEFWRQVVDRVGAETPDTLLLAEAFWLMEGYFVRTLGMHRVYNSAFMNMLKMEENSKYRDTVKNVLEFSPEVLKRFVNFMNNPDELTAVEQFGKGDKYYGVAVMMVTMPGLPMFGHGQIEGFAEKYGMEYRRAYWDEKVDEEMIYRHETEIFPLMRKRYLFSGVENFALFDFYTPEGHVDENVFAYTNRADGERALVMYNNAYGSTGGWINRSTAINIGSEHRGRLVHRSLAEALNLKTDDATYYIFRDHCDGLEFIRSGRQLGAEGLFVKLAGYQYHAFLEWREVKDHDGSWGRLAARLDGAGVPSVGEAYRETLLEPVRLAFQEVINGRLIRALLPGAIADEDEAAEARRAFAESLGACLERLEEQIVHPFDQHAVLRSVLKSVDAVHDIETGVRALKCDEEAVGCLMEPLNADPARFWQVPTLWAALRPLGEVFTHRECDARAANWLDEWMLTSAVIRTFTELGREEWQARLDAELLKIMFRYAELPAIQTASERAELIRAMLDDPTVRDFLYVNQSTGVLWLNKEQLEEAMYWLLFCSVVEVLNGPGLLAEDKVEAIQRQCHRAREILAAAESVGYQVDALLDLLA